MREVNVCRKSWRRLWLTVFALAKHGDSIMCWTFQRGEFLVLLLAASSFVFFKISINVYTMKCLLLVGTIYYPWVHKSFFFSRQDASQIFPVAYLKTNGIFHYLQDEVNRRLKWTEDSSEQKTRFEFRSVLGICVCVGADRIWDPVRSGDPAFFDWSSPVRFGKQILPDHRISMLNLKYRKSGKIFIWKPEFYLSIANMTIQDQMWPDQVWPDQICLYRIIYVSFQDQMWPDQMWPDQICLYRIKYVFTGSSVSLQDQMLPDQMCHTWNLIHCITILIYNFAIRLYPIVLEFCLYNGYLSKEVGSQNYG